MRALRSDGGRISLGDVNPILEHQFKRLRHRSGGGGERRREGDASHGALTSSSVRRHRHPHSNDPAASFRIADDGFDLPFRDARDSD